MGLVPKGAVKGPDKKFLRNADGSYVVREGSFTSGGGTPKVPKSFLKPGHVTADPAVIPPAPIPLPAVVDVASVLKAIVGMSPDERASIAAMFAPPAAAALTPASAGPRLPPGANPFEYLPLEGALKEALFEMGALHRAELGVAGQRIDAVRTSKLAAFIVSRGFPKSRGRTYEGDEHAHEVCINLKQIVENNKRLGMSAPLLGWFNFVGGQAAGSPDNWEWLVPGPAITEAAAQGRVIAPATPAAAPLETPTRKPNDTGAAYAEDLLPGKRSADQIMATMPKLETQTVDHAA